MLFLSHVKDVAASLKKYLFKENNMNRTNNIFWQGLAEFAKSILACVDVTYTGAEGSIQLDRESAKFLVKLLVNEFDLFS